MHYMGKSMWTPDHPTDMLLCPQTVAIITNTLLCSISDHFKVKFAFFNSDCVFSFIKILNMADSEFYMQCEEEELAPCQSSVDETSKVEKTNSGKQTVMQHKPFFKFMGGKLI